MPKIVKVQVDRSKALQRRGRELSRALLAAVLPPCPHRGLTVRLQHGGLPGAPAMWRFGLMGYNANVATADKVLAAFDAVMADAPTLAAA